MYAVFYAIKSSLGCLFVIISHAFIMCKLVIIQADLAVVAVITFRKNFIPFKWFFNAYCFIVNMDDRARNRRLRYPKEWGGAAPYKGWVCVIEQGMIIKNVICRTG